MLTKSQLLICCLLGWMLAMLMLITLFNSVGYEIYFVLSLIGLLVIAELVGPGTVKPRWRTRVNLVIALGMIIFSILMVQKVLNIVGIPLNI
jgi:hypothetical protein